MANLLTITKLTDIFYSFVVNGDTVNAIMNSRNNVTLVGNYAHFKSENGANLIKEQNILFGNITIIDGVTTLIPSSPNDLINKLDSVNFFDWINGTVGGGVDRFDELDDTFSYFGKNGQSLRVNESELKLETFVMPDVSYLNYFPTPLVPLKILSVKADNTGYELIDKPAGSSGLKQEFEYVSGTPEFALGTSAPLTAVSWNGVIMRNSDWTQELSTLTINFTPTSGDIFTPIGNI